MKRVGRTSVFIYLFVHIGHSVGNSATIATFKDYIKDAYVEKVHLQAKKVADSNEMIPLDGLLVRYKEAQANVLICHGFMTCQQDAAILRRLFPKGKFNCMTFNFRAHGTGKGRKGQYCTLGKDEAHDVIAAANFLNNHTHIGHLPLFVYGFSMGAVAAIQAQAQCPLFRAMILDCPFDSTSNIIKRSLDNVTFSLCGYEFKMPGRDLLHDYAFHPYIQTLVKRVLRCFAGLDPREIETQFCSVEPKETIKQVDIPCFFIHCKNDKRTSCNAIKSVFDAAQGYKVLWLTNGRGHFDSYFHNPEQYTYRVRTFLDNVLYNRLPQQEDKMIITDEVDVFKDIVPYSYQATGDKAHEKNFFDDYAHRLYDSLFVRAKS
jgi:pimeloyl-ACP methyl ester carboxylesterase